MELNKNSFKSDALANLYRAAFWIAKGDFQLGKEFYDKATNKLTGVKKVTLSDQVNQAVLAEKILDQFILLR